MKEEKGAAIAEFLLTAGLLILLWTALYNFSSIYAVKQRLASAVRYAAWAAKDKQNGTAEALAIKHYTDRVFVKPSLAHITVKDEGLKLYYKTGQAVAEAQYSAKTLSGVPPVLVRERFSLSGDSWQVLDPKKSEKKYREQLQRGELETDDFKIWKNRGTPVELKGFD
ncbi:MAG: hypothetical protein WCI43_05355 [Candidatus Firestonebacteria bacterium]